MSDSAADAGTTEFTHLWRRVSKICGSKIQNTKTEQHISTAEMSPQRNGEFPDWICRHVWIKSGFERLKHDSQTHDQRRRRLTTLKK